MSVIGFRRRVKTFSTIRGMFAFPRAKEISYGSHTSSARPAKSSIIALTCIFLFRRRAVERNWTKGWKLFMRQIARELRTVFPPMQILWSRTPLTTVSIPVYVTRVQIHAYTESFKTTVHYLLFPPVAVPWENDWTNILVKWILTVNLSRESRHGRKEKSKGRILFNLMGKHFLLLCKEIFQD